MRTTLVFFTIFSLFLAPAALMAQGEELMLNEPPIESFGWYGLGFLVLSAYTLQGYSAAKAGAEESLDLATTSYANYETAATPELATQYREETESHLSQAKSLETKANLGLFIGTIFLATSYFSFFPTHGIQTTFSVSARGLKMKYKF